MMRLTLPEPEIDDNDGFTPETDLFGYKPFGERLANVVENIDERLVILLDGAWGSGKTVFLKQWMGELRKRQVPVIYHDAFANDYQNDAFISLASDVHAYAAKELDAKKGATKNFLEKSKKAGVALMPVATNLGIRLGTLGILNFEDLQDAGEGIKDAVKAVSDESAKLAEKAIAARISGRSNELAAIEAFRTSLRELATALAEKQATQSTEDEDAPIKPLVIVIDELDRCRPDYAIAVIESIKHLFSVDGVCFVLSCDYGQMAAVIHGAYGAGDGFSGQRYFEKFYNIKMTLPDRETRAKRRSVRYSGYVTKQLGLDKYSDGYQRLEYYLSRYAKTKNMSLREIERVASQVALYLSSGAPTTDVLGVIVGLSIIKHYEPAEFDKAKSGRLQFNSVARLLRLEEIEKELRDQEINEWMYLTNEQISGDEFKRLYQIFRYYEGSISDASTTLQTIAINIDSMTLT